MVDELRLVHELGQDTPLRTADELSDVRTRLMLSFTASQAEPAVTGRRAGLVVAAANVPAGVTLTAVPEAVELGTPRTVRPPRRKFRFALGFGLPALTAAAVVAGLLILAPADPITGPTQPAHAADILHRAAVSAATLPDVEPRPDQFLYVKRTVGELWLSMDGTRDGQMTQAGSPEVSPLPGCRNGRKATVDRYDKIQPSITEPCVPRPAYPKLPDTADGMLAYLNGEAAGNTSPTNAAAKEAMDLLEARYLRPKARAALFEALSRFEGVTVVPDAVDGAGRHGIGIGWSHYGSALQVLVFDKQSHEYLGMSGGGGVSELSIVDAAGQRP
ncbi:CU044_5270 family protein [Longispora sp. NPDC051575]|uniref:CU044_5270 family protein n=1 Tax=Longispora sp. NPDC051575 TaxID=3154943 RepID=UPI00342435C1